MSLRRRMQAVSISKHIRINGKFPLKTRRTRRPPSLRAEASAAKFQNRHWKQQQQQRRQEQHQHHLHLKLPWHAPCPQSRPFCFSSLIHRPPPRCPQQAQCLLLPFDAAAAASCETCDSTARDKTLSGTKQAVATTRMDEEEVRCEAGRRGGRREGGSTLRAHAVQQRSLTSAILS
jgi:hypothetical protein